MSLAAIGAARFRCSAAARWVPRVLAGAVLAAGLIIALRMGEQVDSARVQRLQVVLVLGVAVVALWVGRSAPELRLEVEIDQDELRLLAPGQALKVSYASVESARWEPPFAASRHWVPALVLHGPTRSWRLPGLIQDGDRLVDELLGRSARDDLQAWAAAGSLSAKMGRWRLRVALAYLLAGGIVLLASWVPFG